MFLRELFNESRRNPDLNIRTNCLDELRKYKDDDSMFMTLTTINKLGINPDNQHLTPTALYAFPVKLSWDFYGLGDDDAGIEQLGELSEYANYLIIFKVKNMDVRIYNTSGSLPYTEHDLIRDCGTLGVDPIESESPLSSLYLTLEENADGNMNTFGGYFRKLGIYGIIDEGDDMIHPDDGLPIQAAFFNTSNLTVIDTIIIDPKYSVNRTKKHKKIINHDIKPSALKNLILQNNKPGEMVDFAIQHGSRWLEAESRIVKSPKDAIYYVKHFKNSFPDGRWSEAEPYILKKSDEATEYAKAVINDRWPEAEPIIATSLQNILKYTTEVTNRRWPEVELDLLTWPFAARRYYKHFKNSFPDGKWPEADKVKIKPA